MRALLTVALLLAVFAAPGAAADTDTMFKIRRASTIAIGYSEAAKPFSFKTVRKYFVRGVSFSITSADLRQLVIVC